MIENHQNINWFIQNRAFELEQWTYYKDSVKRLIANESCIVEIHI